MHKADGCAKYPVLYRVKTRLLPLGEKFRVRAILWGGQYIYKTRSRQGQPGADMIRRTLLNQAGS